MKIIRGVCYYLSGAGNGTSHQGASLMIRNRLACLLRSHAMASPSRTIRQLVAFFFVVFLCRFYVLPVISYSDIQSADKVVDCRHGIGFNVVLCCSLWSLAILYLRHSAMPIQIERNQSFLQFMCNFVSLA